MQHELAGVDQRQRDLDDVRIPLLAGLTVQLGDKLLEPLDLLAGARPVVRHHHERWDGQGYPDQLAGRHIPLGARIVAVSDSVEVMSSRQLYRAPLKPDQIIAELHRQAGKQWDSDIVEIALALIDSGELVLHVDGLRLLVSAESAV